MNIVILIAWRYLFAKKSHHIINIISMVSMIGVTVGTLGLIVVLSVFNGFGNLVISLYDQFDPDIKITVKEGKFFDPEEAGIPGIKKINGVVQAAEIIEENALLKYRDKQFIARIRGMSNEYGMGSRVKDNMLDGDFYLTRDSFDFAVLGSVVAYSLGISLHDPFYPLQVYVPKKGLEPTLNPLDAFSVSIIHPAGIFAVQQDFDSKYILTPLKFARELTLEDKKVTAIEILTDPESDQEEILAKVKAISGARFLVKDRIAQHDFLFKILRSEKLAVFLILGLILLIATFSIIGSLTMLIIEKKKDITILNSMGAGKKLIAGIFLAEGMMITSIGAFSGLFLGWIICFMQQKFGLIRLENADSFVVENYPVAMQVQDFLFVLLLVTGIGFFASWYTSDKLVRSRKAISMGL